MLIFTSLLEICLISELYSSEQKQLLFSWKQKIEHIWYTMPASYQVPQRRQNSQGISPNLLPLSRRFSLQCVSPSQRVRHQNPSQEGNHVIPQHRIPMFHQRRSVPNIKFSCRTQEPLVYCHHRLEHLNCCY